MPIPDYQEFMLPFLEIISDKKEYTNKDILVELIKKLGLTSDECSEILPNGTEPIITYRLRWAKTYLKKAGLVKYISRGITQITDLGLQVLSQKPEKMNNKYLLQFDTFKDFVNNDTQYEKTSTQEVIEAEKTPDEMIETAKAILSAHLEDNLLEKILDNSPEFFEKMVAKLLCKMGYGGSINDIMQNCGKSGDGGIDGIIKQDALGLDQIHIQAKRYKKDNIVQVGALRDFCGALYGKKNPKGIFITTSSYTKPAIEYAQDNDLILIDGKKLTKLMAEYNVGVQNKEIIEIKKIDEDFFMDED